MFKMVNLSGKQSKSRFTGEYFEKDTFFFTSFPTVDYDITGTGEKITIRNFLRRFGFRLSIRENIAAFSEWIIRDEDTPEIMAHRLYDSTHYYWIITMFNLMADPLFDWPMNDRNLYEYCVKKYGIENVYDHHHYEATAPTEVDDYPEGIIVGSNYPHRSSISNYQHEFKLNEDRRRIKILRPEYLPQLLSEIETIRSSQFTKVI